MNNNKVNFKQVELFLSKHQMGVLSTAGMEHTVWGAAIYFVADDDLNIYFVTRTGSFKYKNIKVQPYAALTVTDSESQVTVQLSGEVSRMSIEKYMDIFFNRLADVRPDGDYHWAPPVDKVNKGNYIPLQLVPSHLQYADYGKHRIEVCGNYIDQIIPSQK